MRLKGFRFPTVVLASILEPDLWTSQRSVARSGEDFCRSWHASVQTYLDLFFAERDAVHDTGTRDLVWFGVLLVLCFQDGMVLRAVVAN